MANCLHDVGQFSEAEALQRDTIAKLRDTLGDTHPDTLVCQANLATTLRASDRAEEAITLQQQVAAGMLRVLGENHPNLLWLLSWTLINRDLEPQPT